VTRFRGPLWRVAGSFAGWLVFVMSFTLLYRSSEAVMGLGGYCASGGPYVIETECPDAVLMFVPWTIFTGIGAVFLATVLARGFGMPLLAWAWPILFLGLGVAFILAMVRDFSVSWLLCGVLFLVMGGVPLWYGLAEAPREILLGSTNAFDVPFTPADRRAARRIRLPRVRAGTAAGTSDGPEPVEPAPGDWALSLGTGAAAIALGIYLANLWFDAVGS